MIIRANSKDANSSLMNDGDEYHELYAASGNSYQRCVDDEDPPECYSCALNGFDATLYDVPGRFVYLRLEYRAD